MKLTQTMTDESSDFLVPADLQPRWRATDESLLPDLSAHAEHAAAEIADTRARALAAERGLQLADDVPSWLFLATERRRQLDEHRTQIQELATHRARVGYLQTNPA
jgi:hypothetical protein